MNILKLTTFALFISALVSCNGGGDATQATMPTAQQPTEQPAAPDTTMAQQPAAQPAAQSQALPQPITDFLQQQFPGATVAYVETDNERGGVEYDVTLNDGTEVDFDLANQWEQVDCKVKAVPAALVPPTIASYVKANYQGLPIIKIDRKPYGYEIELNNGLDIKFDATGKFVGIDD